MLQKEIIFLQKDNIIPFIDKYLPFIFLKNLRVTYLFI